MGPGLAIKAVAGARFSVLTFGLAQIVMDIEPLVGMMRGATVLHGATHTYLAAIFIAIVVAVIAPPICRPILRRWNRELSLHGLAWLTGAESWSAGPVFTGAFAGTLSHVALDSVMHSDITPLAPWLNSNILLGVVSISSLHLVCVATAVLGFVIWLVRALPRRKVGGVV
jgi:uncharacterized membrane protein YvlD (DUF360 family)